MITSDVSCNRGLGHFESLEDIQGKMKTVMKTLLEYYFHNYFQPWQKIWTAYMKSAGEYLKVPRSCQVSNKCPLFWTLSTAFFFKES